MFQIAAFPQYFSMEIWHTFCFSRKREDFLGGLLFCTSRFSFFLNPSKKGTLKKGFIKLQEKLTTRYRILHVFWYWEHWDDPALNGPLVRTHHAPHVYCAWWVLLALQLSFYRIFLEVSNSIHLFYYWAKECLYEYTLLHLMIKRCHWHHHQCQMGTAFRVFHYD